MDIAHDPRAHTVSTLTLRVPAADWQKVISGAATEFRLGANGMARNPIPLPCPVVLFRRRRAGGPNEERLMLLTARRIEALGAISDEGLIAAGFTGERDYAYALFRRHWINSERKKFDPLREVTVYTVEPFQGGHVAIAGEVVIQHLYGAWLQ